MDDNGLFV